jgi:hypothetical protein
VRAIPVTVVTPVTGIPGGIVDGTSFDLQTLIGVFPPVYAGRPASASNLLLVMSICYLSGAGVSTAVSLMHSNDNVTFVAAGFTSATSTVGNMSGQSSLLPTTLRRFCRFRYSVADTETAISVGQIVWADED